MRKRKVRRVLLKPSLAARGLAGALSVAAVSQTSAAATAPPTEARIGAIIDDVVVRATANNACKGMAVVATQGGIRASRFYGVTGPSRRKPTADTIFAIGSITKTMTATLLAWADARGTARLSDPLQKFAPPGVTVPNFRGQRVLLSQLADHTSGLPHNMSRRSAALQPADAWAWLNTARVETAPGSQYRYSNVGYGFLGLALARAHRTTLAQLYERVITGPLGMTDTRLVLTPAQQTRLAAGYRDNDTVGQGSPYFPALDAAGAMYSSLRDMSRYLDFELGRVASPLSAARALMFKPRHSAKRAGRIGLGWQIREFRDGSQVVAKHGSIGGYSSFIIFVPAVDAGAVILANQHRCPVTRMGHQIIKDLVRA